MFLLPEAFAVDAFAVDAWVVVAESSDAAAIAVEEAVDPVIAEIFETINNFVDICSYFAGLFAQFPRLQWWLQCYLSWMSLQS